MVPSQEDALARCRERKEEGIGSILHLLDESTRTETEARALAARYVTLITNLASVDCSGSVSLKVSSLGALISRSLPLSLVRDLAETAVEHSVGFEIDMEGPGMVELAIQAAMDCRQEGLPVTLAIQAYLDRSEVDLSHLQAAGIKPRLVKGAYAGDTLDFEEIEVRFRDLATSMLDAGIPFHVGTHDPVLLSWLQAELEKERDRVQFGFLMGLSDTTKHEMVARGWRVAEYIPLGKEGGAYIFRRQRYLRDLHRLGRVPAP
jgi:proline dehydrogenase